MGIQEPPPSPRVVLTMRGRRAVAGAAVGGVLLLGVGIHALWPSGSAQAGPRPHTPTTTAPPVATSSQTTSAAPRTTTATTTVVTRTTTTSTATAAEGQADAEMRHSNLPGSRAFTTSTVAIAAAKKTPTTHTFVVKVESTVKAVPNDVATQIEQTLNDPRGWIGFHGASFAAVADPAKAEFVIYLAAPPTVDKMCAPVQTLGTWNCENGKNVILNSDRWSYMTPTYSNLAEYRSYMVNHEIGHFLGLGHVGCPKRGGPAPVMMTQSMDLQGCVKNAWPTSKD